MSGSSAEPASVQVVRFASTRPGEVIVPVFIGSSGPHRFLLDTGSSHTAISEALGAALGLRPVAQTTMATSVGVVRCGVVRIDSVVIGPARAEGLLATVLPAEATTVLGREVAGVIGQDFLSQFNYTVDYRRSRIVWDEQDFDAKGAMRLALVRSADRFLVELPQKRGRDEWLMRLVPDSGADVIILFESPNADRLFSAQPDGRRLHSLSGEGAVRAGTIDELQVGAARLYQQSAAFVPSRAAGEDGDGLLPLHLFASVSFNNGDGYMIVRSR